MIIASFVAAALLLVVAALCWRVSRNCAIALSIAGIGSAYWIASILLGSMPWDGARWGIAWLTGCIGAIELRAVGASRRLGALLVGSSIADFVSLYRESKGGEFGALPVLTIAVLVAMAWMAYRAPKNLADR